MSILAQTVQPADVLHALGGGSHKDPERIVMVRGLIKISKEPPAMHEHGWRTSWSREDLLLKDYFDHPLDAYSFAIADAKACVDREPLLSCWTKEENGNSGRTRVWEGMWEGMPKGMLVLEGHVGVHLGGHA